MPQAKKGDTVGVHYTGKLEDGTVFDSSTDRDPLEFTIGAGQIIPGFEEAIIGMNPGESNTTTISADKAYGPHDEDMVMVIDRNEFPEHLELEVDQQLQIPVQDDRTIAVTVTDVSELSVTLDANHPLAGEDLTFDIQLAAIAQPLHLWSHAARLLRHWAKGGAAENSGPKITKSLQQFRRSLLAAFPCFVKTEMVQLPAT